MNWTKQAKPRLEESILCHSSEALMINLSLGAFWSSLLHFEHKKGILGRPTAV